jgi:hypothetical protein
MLIYRADLRELFVIMKAAWTEITADEEEKQLFLKYLRNANTYFVAHCTVQTTIVFIYVAVPFLLYGGQNLMQPVWLPGTDRHSIINYFFLVLIVYTLAYYTLFLGYMFILPVIHVVMEINHLVKKLNEATVVDFRAFHRSHLELLAFTKKLSKIFAFFGMVYSTQIAGFSCVNVYFITEVGKKVTNFERPA